MKLRLLCLGLVLTTQIAAKEEKILSRKRRYLSFPDGSSFSASICMTIGVIGNPAVEYLSYAINWGVAYNLPNNTWVEEHKHGFKHAKEEELKMKNRNRRDLYEAIEIALDSIGFDGRHCLSRTLCESTNFFPPGLGNMVEKIVKTIFSFPVHDDPNFVDPEANHYDVAFHHGRKNGDCAWLYPNCHFSLLEMALGDYSVEPVKFGPGKIINFIIWRWIPSSCKHIFGFDIGKGTNLNNLWIFAFFRPKVNVFDLISV